MPIYLYKGFDTNTGEERKGKIEAESLKAARQKLRSTKKIIPAEVKEELAVQAGSTTSLFSSNKVSLQDLAILMRQFATLQTAQVPLDECLRALTNQVENVTLRNTLSAVKDLVSEGKALADAMQQYPNVFDNLSVNMVRAGEASGNLGLVLERLADFQEYQIAVKGKVFSALAYPAIMILAAFAIILYLFLNVVPELQKVFVDLKAELPWYTEAVIGFSEFLQEYWYIILLSLLACFFIFKSWHASASGRLKIDRFSLEVPVFGPLLMRLNVSKFTKTLSTLLGSGVPIISALEMTKNVLDNRIISNVIEDSKIAVQEGASLGNTLERSGEFPSLVSHMIKTGEKTGELENMLHHVSVAYDAEVERKIESMISLIEPLMIILMGAVVVLVVVALLVPMMNVMDSLG